ncbi:MAG TPA: VanZ family protein [Nitrospira sp.]|nr:VanZ family protein [Nitrospira sp.]
MKKVLPEFDRDSVRRWAWSWLPVVGYAALIFYLSSLPHPEEKLPKILFEKVGDKLLHLVEYAVLGVLCYRAFSRAAGPGVARRAVILSIAAASFYGMTDEVHQAFVPFRESSWLDWVADTAGAAAGVLAVRRVTQHERRPAHGSTFRGEVRE